MVKNDEKRHGELIHLPSSLNGKKTTTTRWRANPLIFFFCSFFFFSFFWMRYIQCWHSQVVFGPHKQRYFESVACLDLVLPNHSAETVRVSAPLVLGCQRPSSRTGHHALWNCNGAGRGGGGGLSWQNFGPKKQAQYWRGFQSSKRLTNGVFSPRVSCQCRLSLTVFLQPPCAVECISLIMCVR